jgi:hypothetical protein
VLARQKCRPSDETRKAIWRAEKNEEPCDINHLYLRHGTRERLARAAMRNDSTCRSAILLLFANGLTRDGAKATSCMQRKRKHEHAALPAQQ